MSFSTLFLLTSYLVQHALSDQCMVVWVNFESIDPSLDATDWQGTYTSTDTTTTNNCLMYQTSFGASLEYHSGSWSLHSSTNSIITYTTTTSTPCNPPLNTNQWTHGINGTSDSEITITCSLTSAPSYEPTIQPSYEPTVQPTTSSPTSQPTIEPTINPSELPTTIPTIYPTKLPTINPTDLPTIEPTFIPTEIPSIYPTATPSFAPVLTPTIAPTETCTKISLYAKYPLELDSIFNGATPVDGIYYQQDTFYPGTQYPYYKQYKSGHVIQLGPTNNAIIAYIEGYWTILEMENNINLKYQQNNPDPTLHTPPHSTIGNGWTDINMIVPPPYLWDILIECMIRTDNPTIFPTYEPTNIPTAIPTIEPTYEPSNAKPTFVPTQEPIVSTYNTINDAGGKNTDSFLDSLTTIEWLIIALIPLCCCIIIGSLYLWRNKEIKKAIHKEAAHNLSANSPSDNEMGIEMGPKKRNTQLDFGKHKRQSTTEIEANFADALAVVSKHKIQNSQINNYETIDAQSPPITSEIANENINDDTNTEIPLINNNTNTEIEHTDSEFYGNHPIDEIYSYTFISKPFGMEWKTTKKDKKNLYVSKVQQNSHAATGNVLVGSRLISFNGEMIEDLGAKKIYGKLALSDMPLTITFLKPYKKDEDKEGDNYKQVKDNIPPAVPVEMPQNIIPPAVPAEIPPPNIVPPVIPNNYIDQPAEISNDNEIKQQDTYEQDPFAEIGPPPITPVQNRISIMEKAQELIPEVFADDEDQVNAQESFHAD
eukprot:1005645_1